MPVDQMLIRPIGPSSRRTPIRSLGLARSLAVSLALCATFASSIAQAQAPVRDGNISARVERLERTLGSSSLVQMLDTLQRLRQEVRQLRGEVEVQANQIRKLKASQKQLYLDLDERIQAVQTAPPASGDTLQAQDGAEEPVVIAAPAPDATTETNAAAPSTPPPNTTATPAAGADPAAEQLAYRAAFDLLKSRKYSQASKAFSEFLQEYPNGRFADNAQYWLGEAYYVNRQFDPAMKAFEALVADFPDSPKRGHALLKMGFIHDESGRKAQAREVLEALVASDPTSTAAGLARKRLTRLQ